VHLNALGKLDKKSYAFRIGTGTAQYLFWFLAAILLLEKPENGKIN